MYLDTCEFCSLLNTPKTFQDALKCPSDALKALPRHMYLDTREFCSPVKTHKTFQDALKCPSDALNALPNHMYETLGANILRGSLTGKGGPRHGVA